MYPLIERDVRRFWKHVLLPDVNGCMHWTGPVDRDGYGQFKILLNTINTKTHRVSAQLAGLDIEGQVVRHGCDVRICVAPGHLSVGSHSDNHADMVSRRRHLFGERHPDARLTEDVVVAISTRFLAGDRQADLARAFDVDPAHVQKIVSGHIWRHATEHLLSSYWRSRAAGLRYEIPRPRPICGEWTDDKNVSHVCHRRHGDNTVYIEHKCDCGSRLVGRLP